MSLSSCLFDRSGSRRLWVAVLSPGRKGYRFLQSGLRRIRTTPSFQRLQANQFLSLLERSYTPISWRFPITNLQGSILLRPSKYSKRSGGLQRVGRRQPGREARSCFRLLSAAPPVCFTGWLGMASQSDGSPALHFFPFQVCLVCFTVGVRGSHRAPRSARAGR